MECDLNDGVAVRERTPATLRALLEGLERKRHPTSFWDTLFGTQNPAP